MSAIRLHVEHIYKYMYRNRHVIGFHPQFVSFYLMDNFYLDKFQKSENTDNNACICNRTVLLMLWCYGCYAVVALSSCTAHDIIISQCIVGNSQAIKQVDRLFGSHSPSDHIAPRFAHSLAVSALFWVWAQRRYRPDDHQGWTPCVIHTPWYVDLSPRMPLHTAFMRWQLQTSPILMTNYYKRQSVKANFEAQECNEQNWRKETRIYGEGGDIVLYGGRRFIDCGGMHDHRGCWKSFTGEEN